MPQEYGNNWRVKIKTAAGPPAVFTAIGGEKSFSWKRSSTPIDLSDKDSGAYGSQSFGSQTVSISVSGNVKLPDTGLKAAFDASKASPPEATLQIIKGTTVKFEALVGIGNFSTEGGRDQPMTYSFDASNIGAPTIDDLGA